MHDYFQCEGKDPEIRKTDRNILCLGISFDNPTCELISKEVSTLCCHAAYSPSLSSTKNVNKYDCCDRLNF